MTSHTSVFWSLLALAAAYALAALLASWTSRGRPPGGWAAYALIDLVLLGGLALAAGGATSEIADLLAVVPALCAFVGRPRTTMIATLAAMGVYGVVVALRPDDIAVGGLVGQGLLYAWPGAVGVLTAFGRTRMVDEVSELSDARGRLLNELQHARERERDQLAYALHDEAVQSLLTADLLLDSAGAGDARAATDARGALRQAIDQLRQTVNELRSYEDLDGPGLAAALDALAVRLSAEHEVEITVAAAAEAQLGGKSAAGLFAVARELLTNACRHGQANEVRLALTAEAAGAKLTVTDDGVGIPAGRRAQARTEGHIGLSLIAERVDALGGTLSIAPTFPGGTTGTVWIPLQPVLPREDKNSVPGGDPLSSRLEQ